MDSDYSAYHTPSCTVMQLAAMTHLHYIVEWCNELCARWYGMVCGRVKDCASNCSTVERDLNFKKNVQTWQQQQ